MAIGPVIDVSSFLQRVEIMVNPPGGNVLHLMLAATRQKCA
jgi:hypothetical protein